MTVSGNGIGYECDNSDEWSVGYGKLIDTVSLSAGNGEGSIIVSGSLTNSEGTTYSF